MKQTERIHHRCNCIGRDFNFGQWCEYHREHPGSSGEPVFTHRTFGYNISDVCVTPNRPVRIKNKVCRLEILTAESPNGRWGYGLTLLLYQEGHTWLPSFICDPETGFPSERDAVYAGLSFAERETVRKIKETELRGGDRPVYPDDEESGREQKPSAILSSLRAFLNEIRGFKDYHDPSQPSLFDCLDS